MNMPNEWKECGGGAESRSRRTPFSGQANRYMFYRSIVLWIQYPFVRAGVIGLVIAITSKPTKEEAKEESNGKTEKEED